MSQYPVGPTQQPVGYHPQYSFMQYYSATPEQLLAPAKWAGWLMIALGVLLLLAGTCGGAAAYSVDDAAYLEIIRQLPKQDPAMQVEFTPRLMRIVYGAFGGVIGVYGLILLLCGTWVRGGSIVSVIFGLIATIVPVIFILLMFLASLTGGIASAVMFIVLMIVPFALLASAFVFLIRAAGNASKITQSRQQWAMIQQQQMQQYYAYQQPPIPPTQS